MAEKLTGAGFQIDIDIRLVNAVGKIPVLLRAGPLPRCLTAFGKPIAKAAPTFARSSRATGTRLKWSRKYKLNPAYQVDSGKYFGTKVPKHGMAVIVGAKYPQGNKQQFNMPARKGDTYEHVLWGRRTGRTIRFPVEDRATRRAFTSAKMVSIHQFLAQLRKELGELKLG
jgi:hypothetical protein